MIVICPACATRYLVEDEELGGEAGRRVRCASCGNLWRYTPDAAAIHAAVAVMAAEAEQAARAAMPATQTAAPSQVPIETMRVDLRPEPGAGAATVAAGPGAAPSRVVRPPVEVTLPAAARRRTARTAGLGLLVLALTLVLVLILARDRILATYPSTAPVYATFRLIEPPGAGLEIIGVRTSWSSDSLVVTGDIVNHSAIVRRPPQLRINISDGNRNQLGSQVIDPPAAQLQPGATVHFTTAFDHPGITANAAEATFVTK